MSASISAQNLLAARQNGFGPQIVDVRRNPAYVAATAVIAGAIRRDPDDVANWWRNLDLARSIIVYCVHGHEVSQSVAAYLQDHGLPAQFIEGGFEAWQTIGAPISPKPAAPTIWVTRARPKIDRIACPWLIRRFIDPDARIVFAPARDVVTKAAEIRGVAFDIPDVEFTHVGDGCSFDTFIAKYKLTAPALKKLADVVRGADTDRLELAAPAAGLFAISLGLSANIADDYEMLRHGIVIYDALYRYYAELGGETHNWPPNMQT